MTILGPDLSSYQHGLDLSRLADATFVLAKTTEGTYYTDADYQGWRRQAASLGKLFGWYHYLSTEPVAGQVAHTKSNVGDISLFGMLDVEKNSGDLAQVLAYIDAAHGAGLNLRLVYLPHWYWQQIGSPDLSGLAARGVGIVSSAYPGGQGYPGDNAAGWSPYGGMTPVLYQYTDVATEGGQNLGDMNAYRGTRDQLAAFLGSTSTPTGGTTVSVLDHQDAITVWSYSHGDAPDVHQTLDNAAAWAGQSNSKLDQVNANLAAIAAHVGAPVTIDVNALAASLGPLIHPSMDVPAFVAALVPHLPSQPDPVAFAAAFVPALISHVKVV